MAQLFSSSPSPPSPTLLAIRFALRIPALPFSGGIVYNLWHKFGDKWKGKNV